MKSLILKTKLSRDRSTAVVNYLMSKGIARTRLLDRWVGAIEPIAIN